MNNNGKLIASVLAGLAIGAILGILFAPEKGSQIRNKLAGAFKRQGSINEDEVMDNHDEFKTEELIDEAVKHGKLKRPAGEKLKETKDKIMANAPQIANGIAGNN